VGFAWGCGVGFAWTFSYWTGASTLKPPVSKGPVPKGPGDWDEVPTPVLRPNSSTSSQLQYFVPTPVLRPNPQAQSESPGPLGTGPLALNPQYLKAQYLKVQGYAPRTLFSGLV
jgi:hypothetical protein